MENNQFDIIIIGAGIVGLSTGLSLKNAKPTLKIAILEKESIIAKHQTGNNSGVIHSGIYYKPNSEKAINCKKGYDEIINFSKEYGIKHELCGKIIVATKNEELLALENIYNRGLENRLIGIKKISTEEIKEIEPHVKAVKGIFVPQTGIIDYKEVSKKYAELFETQGGQIFFNTKVIGSEQRNGQSIVKTNKGDFHTKLIISCAGLYSDKMSEMTNDTNNFKIIPFRGEYYELIKEKEYLVKNLIYPVPNPDFPFLGVHFTRMINGGIEAGPNAVLAFRREGYNRFDVNIKELVEILAFSGFRKIASKYWDEGLLEMKRSFSKQLFVHALQELVPEIECKDVYRAGAGVRAQACDADGNLIDDFLFTENKYAINVCNAPSPAATASLAIGKSIAEKALKRF